ncbi:TnsD family transposase [Priestia koreensis]|uniref:TnsD family transposase n=1 Tax=Priestia koreensis TaxID=284581 RepID=UPI00203E238A|nr:TnsD family transposase [Priestia koreensis]MCM3006707.1 TnsD family transposase [Priestia koreensis]
MILFPTLYDDELLHSVLARYHHYVGNENKKVTMDDLFGSTTICASIVLPSNLKKLCTRLPSSDVYTPDYLIDHFTLFPYYAPFIPESRYKELRAAMIEDIGTNIYMKLGITASKIKSPKFLRYCSECFREDELKHGEPYWHRTHQIEGVEICPIHNSSLIKSDIPTSQRKNKHEYFRLKSENGCINHIKQLKSGDSPLFEHYKFIAEQTYYLINSKIEPFGLENLSKFYVVKLQEKGLATISGGIRWRELVSEFNHYYGEEILDYLDSLVKDDQKDTWLHKMFRKPKVSCHPLRHILLLGFLGETISSMVLSIKSVNYEPFGSGPWPCLNKVANHYQKPVINSCSVTRDYRSRTPIGTFSCICGFVYSRKGPDKFKDDTYKIGRIKEFGHVWENKLNELAKMELSLRKKAELLGVDPMTVKRKLFSQENEKSAVSCNLTTRSEYRKKWIGILHENINKSITEIREGHSKIYFWLYRNDNEWLRNHYPKEKFTKGPSIKRVDWNERDQETAFRVEAIAKAILSESNNLIRVTKNEIGRRLGNLGSLYKNIDKMPKTKQVISEVVEPLEDFQVRRIKHIAKELKKTNPSIKEWQLIRAAGLKKEFVDKHKRIIQCEVTG